MRSNEIIPASVRFMTIITRQHISISTHFIALPAMHIMRFWALSWHFFDLATLDDERKLNDDFQLGIASGKQKTPYKSTYNGSAELREIRRKKCEHFEKWEKEAWQTIHEHLWFMRDWLERYKPLPENINIDERFNIANVEYHHAEEISLDWIQVFSNENKVSYQWVLDKIKKFLNEHKSEENPRNPESPRTDIVISKVNSPNDVPVNWR